MSDEEKESGRGWGWIFLALLGAVVFYVLSVGPVALIFGKTNAGKNAVEVVYAPLIWLHRNTPLREPLEAYVRLWGVR